VEAYYASLPEDLKKTESEEYGLIYFYRKNELEKALTPEIQNTEITEVQTNVITEVQPVVNTEAQKIISTEAQNPLWF